MRATSCHDDPRAPSPLICRYVYTPCHWQSSLAEVPSDGPSAVAQSPLQTSN